MSVKYEFDGAEVACRTHNLLANRLGLRTWAEAAGLDLNEIAQMGNVGKKTIREIVELCEGVRD